MEFLQSNYHTHTFRCRHASGSEREYIEAAIDMGIRILGFADHVPIPFKNGFVSGIRMTMSEAEGYVTTLRKLGREYGEDIRILVGFEAEYIPEFYPEQIAFFRELEIDYMIMGQHFLESEETGPYMGSETWDENRIRGYVDSVIEGMKTGSYAYLAHPDLIHFLGAESVYDREMTRLCRELKALDIPLEMNILGMAGRRHYPAERFWRIASAEGNKVIMGLDAHCIEHLTDELSCGECRQMAKRLGLNVIDRLDLREGCGV